MNDGRKTNKEIMNYIKQLESRIEELEATVETLNINNEKLCNQLNERIDKEHNIVKKQVDDLAGNIASLEEHVDELEGENDIVKEQNDDLEERVDYCERVTEEGIWDDITSMINDEIDGIDENIKLLYGLTDSMKQRIDTLKNEKRELVGRLCCCEQNIGELRSTIELLIPPSSSWKPTSTTQRKPISSSWK